MCQVEKKMAVKLSLQSKHFKENPSFHLVYLEHSLEGKDGRCPLACMCALRSH